MSPSSEAVVSNDKRWAKVVKPLSSLSEVQRESIKGLTDAGYCHLFNLLSSYGCEQLFPGLATRAARFEAWRDVSSRLQSYFKLDEAQGLWFQGDFDVLVMLFELRFQLKAGNTEGAGFFQGWSELWPDEIGGERIDKQQRYEQRVRTILTDGVLTLSEHVSSHAMSQRQFKQQLAVFEQIMRVFVRRASAEPSMPDGLFVRRSVFEVLRDVFKSLLALLGRLFGRKPKAVPVALVDRVVRLGYQLDLLADERFKPVLTYYESKGSVMQSSSYFYERYLRPETGYVELATQKGLFHHVTDVVSHWTSAKSRFNFMSGLNERSNKASIDALLTHLKDDLKRIKAVGFAESKHTVLAGLSKQERKSKSYLLAYEQFQTRLQRFSEASAEIWLRYVKQVESKRCSLENLAYFAELLLALNQTEVRAAKEAWRAQFEQLFPGDNFFRDANLVLSALEDEGAEKLNSALTWVHYTMYAAGRTEGIFGTEMTARNRERKRHGEPVFFTGNAYSLHDVQTLSDYLFQMFERYTRLVKQATSQRTHPDKVGGDDELRAVSDYCFQKLTFLRERTKDLQAAWARGQYNWRAVNKRTGVGLLTDAVSSEGVEEAPPEATAEESGDDTLSFVDIPVPEHEVDLPFFQLRAEYLTWAAGQGAGGLDKAAVPTAKLNHFYEGSSDKEREGFVLSRCLHVMSIQRIKRAKAEQAAAEASIAESQREIETYRREIAEYRREKEEHRREKEEHRREKEDALERMIELTLAEHFLDKAVTPSEEVVRKILRSVVERVGHFFRAHPESDIEARALRLMSEDKGEAGVSRYAGFLSCLTSGPDGSTSGEARVSNTPGTLYHRSEVGQAEGTDSNTLIHQP